MLMNNLERIQPPVFPPLKLEIPEAISCTLDNGIPVFLIESGTEEIMRLEFTFRAGQIKEYMPLLASTTVMMLSEGSQNYTSEELNRQLDYYGIFLKQDADKDHTEVVLYSLNKHLEKVLELSHEIIFHPVFPRAELDALMKKRHRWYLVNREKVSKLAEDQFFESVFGKTHSYGYKVLEKDFTNIDRSILLDFHSKNYSPYNMAVIISGKIPARTTELLNYYFGKMPLKNYGDNTENLLLTGEKKKNVFVRKPGSVQNAVRIGSSTINKRHPDYPGLKILDSILGGYFGSRLMKNIREDKGYTYGIHSAVNSLDLTGYKLISTEVGKNNYTKAINEIYREIGILQKTRVEKKEMDVVRNYMSGEMVRMFDGPFALARSFKSAWQFGLDNNYYYRLAEKIRLIDPDEIIELARTYYNIDELYEIIAGAK
jgi:zinc protease